MGGFKNYSSFVVPMTIVSAYDARHSLRYSQVQIGPL